MGFRENSGMGEIVKIKSDDGFEFDAYLAKPTGQAKGGILVIQEIFGVNSHIRSVADGYADAGYAAIAPAIFDRAEPGVELGYEQEDMVRGVGIARGKLKIPETLADLAATVDELKEYGKVGAVGYCFGGLLAYLSACNLENLACAVGYYGGGITGVLDQKPAIPLMLHFGERDEHISMSDVDDIKAANPGVPVFTYDADHGFNCDQRASYDKAASVLALEKTLAFFAEQLA
jgi:carboxymethylenebutenolidase